MNAAAWLLLGLFGVIAAADWVAVQRRPASKPLEYVCKPGCMVALVGAALAMDPADGGARTALVVALVLSLLGDVFLMLPDRFVPGLASFLLAHVAYVVAFVLAGLDGPWLAAGVVVAVVIVVTVGRRMVVAAKGSDEPELAAPVGAYVGVIATMVAAAIGTGDARAIGGAGLFAFSDSLIAYGKFVRVAAWGPLAVIVTYHAAQALLVLSFS